MHRLYGHLTAFLCSFFIVSLAQAETLRLDPTQLSLKNQSVSKAFGVNISDGNTASYRNAFKMSGASNQRLFNETAQAQLNYGSGFSSSWYGRTSWEDFMNAVKSDTSVLSRDASNDPHLSAKPVIALFQNSKTQSLDTFGIGKMVYVVRSYDEHSHFAIPRLAGYSADSNPSAHDGVQCMRHVANLNSISSDESKNEIIWNFSSDDWDEWRIHVARQTYALLFALKQKGIHQDIIWQIGNEPNQNNLSEMVGRNLGNGHHQGFCGGQGTQGAALFGQYVQNAMEAIRFVYATYKTELGLPDQPEIAMGGLSEAPGATNYMAKALPSITTPEALSYISYHPYYYPRASFGPGSMGTMASFVGDGTRFPNTRIWLSEFGFWTALNCASNTALCTGGDSKKIEQIFLDSFQDQGHVSNFLAMPMLLSMRSTDYGTPKIAGGNLWHGRALMQKNAPTLLTRGGMAFSMLATAFNNKDRYYTIQSSNTSSSVLGNMACSDKDKVCYAVVVNHAVDSRADAAAAGSVSSYAILPSNGESLDDVAISLDLGSIVKAHTGSCYTLSTDVANSSLTGINFVADKPSGSGWLCEEPLSPGAIRIIKYTQLGSGGSTGGGGDPTPEAPSISQLLLRLTNLDGSTKDVSFTNASNSYLIDRNIVKTYEVVATAKLSTDSIALKINSGAPIVKTSAAHFAQGVEFTSDTALALSLSAQRASVSSVARTLALSFKPKDVVVVVPSPPSMQTLSLVRANSQRLEVSWTIADVPGMTYTLSYKPSKSAAGYRCDDGPNVVRGITSKGLKFGGLVSNTVYAVAVCAVNAKGEKGGVVHAVFRTKVAAP